MIEERMHPTTEQVIKDLDEEIEREAKLAEAEYSNARAFYIMSSALQKMCEKDKPKFVPEPYPFSVETFSLVKERREYILSHEYYSIRAKIFAKIKQRVLDDAKSPHPKNSTDEALAIFRHLKKRQDELDLRAKELNIDSSWIEEHASEWRV